MTPRRITTVALCLMLVLALLELLGARTMTATLAGSAVDSPTLGLAYVVMWFATMLLAPPLLLTGAVLTAVRMAQRRHR